MKDDMHFVSGSYMIEVNDYIKNLAHFFFQKAKKDVSHDFNPDTVTTYKSLTITSNRVCPLV